MAFNVKTSRVLLPVAQRSENTASAVQTDPAAEALRFYLDITDMEAGSLQVVLRGYDKASAKSVELTTGGVPVTQIGTYCYEVTNYPSSVAFGQVVESASRAVPYQWDALVKHGDNSLCRYSLSVEVVK